MAIPVFDGHNDILLRLWNAPGRRHDIWLQGEGRGHLDLPRMQAGGFAGGLFAIYVPSPDMGDPGAVERAMDNPPYAMPLPEPVPLARAQEVAMAQAGHLLGMVRDSGGAFALCCTVAEIRAAMARGCIAGVMHMEGVDTL